MRAAATRAAAAAAAATRRGQQERRRPRGLAGLRGLAKFKRTHRQEQIAERVRYEKRKEHDFNEAWKKAETPDDDELPKYLADKVRKSQRGPGNVRLGRKDLRAGLMELDLMKIEDADETIAPRVKVHHRDLLRKGIPKPRGQSPVAASRRQQRAESRLEQAVQEAFINREMRLLDAVTSRIVGYGAFSTVECSRVSVSGDLRNVTVYWRPPLHKDFSSLHPDDVDIVAEAMRRCTPQIRAIVARRMQHHRAPFVTIEMDNSESGLGTEAEKALRDILKTERDSVAHVAPEVAKFSAEAADSNAGAASSQPTPLTETAPSGAGTSHGLSPMEERLLASAKISNPGVSEEELLEVLLESRDAVRAAAREDEGGADVFADGDVPEEGDTDALAVSNVDDVSVETIAEKRARLSAVENSILAGVMVAPLSHAEEMMLADAIEAHPDVDEAILRKLLLEAREETLIETVQATSSRYDEITGGNRDMDDDFDEEDLPVGDDVELPREEDFPPEFQEVMRRTRMAADGDEDLVQSILRELQQELAKNGPPRRGPPM